MCVCGGVVVVCVCEWCVRACGECVWCVVSVCVCVCGVSVVVLCGR